MTIKHMTKNISAEDITTLFDIQVQRDNNNQINHIILTRKNFYEGEADTSHDLLDYFYTKKQIDDRVKVHLKIYPTKAALESATDSDAKQENYIYLVPYGNTGDHNEGKYKEYVYAKDSNGTYYYEEVGSTELDLQPILTRISNLETNYIQKSQTSGLVKNDGSIISLDTTIQDNSNNPVTSGAVYDALDSIEVDSSNIDLTDYIQKSQTSGLVKNDGTIAPLDTTPQNNSNNPISSGGVYSELQNKADKTNATSSQNGLMSSQDKTKLDSYQTVEIDILYTDGTQGTLNIVTRN